MNAIENIVFNKNKWSIYIHKCITNNKAYIGIAKGNPFNRWGANGKKYQENSQPVFYNAIQKYGWDGFEHIIWAVNLDHDEAKHMEKMLIALFKTNCRRYKKPAYGYNETDGGDGSAGREVKQETRDKIGNAHRGKVLSVEHKEKISNSLIGKPGTMKGKHHSEETKEKMSRSHVGMVFTDEHRKNMSLANQKETAGFHNHQHTEEAKQKQREAIAARNATPEWKENNRLKLSKPIVQCTGNDELIKVWSWIQGASDALDILKSGIIRCCQGKHKTAGGFIWHYLYNQTIKDGTIIPGAITLGLITEEEALAQLNNQGEQL
jgi:group I intron endonuclease